MTEQILQVETHGAVALLRLNRPEHGNAWSDELSAAYYVALEQADGDPAVRAIVVTGAGKSFCVGGDSSHLDAIAEVGTVDLDTPRTPLYRTTRIRKPVIAAINGGCAGIGLVQAMMCDIRFAARSAKFTTAYARMGLPAEQAMSWVLPRTIGVSNALDILLSARVFDGAEAERIGLVSRAVDDVVPEALAYAAQLAERSSPASMAAIKRQVWRDLERGVVDSMDIADELTDHLVSGPDFRAGVAALRTRGVPEFPPLAPGDPR